LPVSSASRFCYLVDPVTDNGYGVKQVNNKPFVLANFADSDGNIISAWVNTNQIKVTPYGSNGTELKHDTYTGFFIGMNEEHHEIHEGCYYRFGFQKDVGNAGTAIVGFTTPDTTNWFHFRPSVDSEAEVRIQIYENVTSLTGGSAVTPRNADRNSAKTSSLVVVSDPVVNSTGAVMLTNIVIGSGKASGGFVSAENEWILKQNTMYALVVTNNTTSDNQVNIRCAGYEHVNL